MKRPLGAIFSTSTFLSMLLSLSTYLITFPRAAFGQSAQPTSAFNGLYLGVTIGDAVGRSQARASTVFVPPGFSIASGTYFQAINVPAVNSTGMQTVNPTGFLGGGEVGYNIRHGRWVVGAEGDFSAVNASNTKTGTTAYPSDGTSTFTITQSLSTNYLLTARPRAGIVMGHLLAYVTGGLAATHVKYDELFTDTFSAQESAFMRRNMAGWTAGGGFEYQIARHLSVKGEYLYAGFSQITGTSSNLAQPSATFPASVFTVSDHLHVHVVRAGFNYTF